MQERVTKSPLELVADSFSKFKTVKSILTLFTKVLFFNNEKHTNIPFCNFLILN